MLLPLLRLAARLVLLLALGSGAAHAGDAADLTHLLSRQVVLVGEAHGSTGSLDLTSRLVRAALRRQACVTLALEIGQGQQAALDAAMRGEAPVRDIRLYPAIGHPAYRLWLSGLSATIPSGACFQVLAADLPARQSGNRDRSIARQIAAQVKAGRFVVGLFGALHVSRGVWYRYSAHHAAADYLTRQGISAYSVLDSHAAACSGAGLRPPGSVEAATAISDLRQTVNGSYPKDPAAIVDAVWLGAAGGCSTSAVDASSLLN